jgi:addiction module HigA family antidote
VATIEGDGVAAGAFIAADCAGGGGTGQPPAVSQDNLVPLGLSVNALAPTLGVPATRLHEIVKERRSVSADTAARLARHFGGDASAWLVMQANYDLKTLPTLADIERQVSVRAQPAA